MKPFTRERIQSIRDGAAEIVARNAVPGAADIDTSPERRVVQLADYALSAETDREFGKAERRLRNYIISVRESGDELRGERKEPQHV